MSITSTLTELHHFVRISKQPEWNTQSENIQRYVLYKYVMSTGFVVPCDQERRNLKCTPVAIYQHKKEKNTV